MVGRWPCSPLELNLLTSGDRCADGSIGGAQVADDVRAGVVIAGNESVGQVRWVRPADNRWRRALVLHGGAVTLIVGTTNDKALDVTVGGDRGRKRGHEGNSGEDRHF